MTTTTSTTIAGVSVLTKDRRQGEAFDIGLSHQGIEIRRPGREPRQLSWNRVSEWEIEERTDDVVLTLRGDGAATPLAITGWSVEGLEALMRTVTSTSTAFGEPTAAKGDTAAESAEGGAAGEAGVAQLVQTAPVTVTTPLETEEAPSRAASRQERRRSRRERRRNRHLHVGAKAVVIVVLLLALAAAVTLVLLQSAGVIDWGFLGPTA